MIPLSPRLFSHWSISLILKSILPQIGLGGWQIICFTASIHTIRNIKNAEATCTLIVFRDRKRALSKIEGVGHTAFWKNFSLYFIRQPVGKRGFHTMKSLWLRLQYVFLRLATSNFIILFNHKKRSKGSNVPCTSRPLIIISLWAINIQT